MKFIHLSDLHLGKRVNDFSMLEDQEYILTRIINIVDEEDGQTAPPSAAQALEQKLGQARELAQQDPKVVANIIKDWTGSNAG